MCLRAVRPLRISRANHITFFTKNWSKFRQKGSWLSNKNWANIYIIGQIYGVRRVWLDHQFRFSSPPNLHFNPHSQTWNTWHKRGISCNQWDTSKWLLPQGNHGGVLICCHDIPILSCEYLLVPQWIIVPFTCILMLLFSIAVYLAPQSIQQGKWV